MVCIAQVVDVNPHPTKDLDIVTLDNGSQNVANRPAPNVQRYTRGDYAIVFEENLIFPEWLMRHLDLWNEEKNKGYMAGSKGNRTKGRNMDGISSNVVLCSIKYNKTQDDGGTNHKIIISEDDPLMQCSITTDDTDELNKQLFEFFDLKTYTPE